MTYLDLMMILVAMSRAVPTSMMNQMMRRESTEVAAVAVAEAAVAAALRSESFASAVVMATCRQLTFALSLNRIAIEAVVAVANDRRHHRR